MPWPPAPLPVNFQNATLSLNTHPTSHNATNGVINNDIVPKINSIDVAVAGIPKLIAAIKHPVGVVSGPTVVGGIPFYAKNGHAYRYKAWVPWAMPSTRLIGASKIMSKPRYTWLFCRWRWRRIVSSIPG